MTTNENVTVLDNPTESRFEVHVDGELAGVAEYRRSPTTLELTHTEVEEAYDGRGLAGQLAATAFAQASATGLQVVPTCEYMAKYAGKHPELLDLVPADRRAELGL